jgi:hypothetical protein
MTQFAQLYPFGLIRYTQSTFLELVTNTEVHRIDFRSKLSFRLQRGTYGPISFHQEHPLLKGVNAPLTSLMARATLYPLLDAPVLLDAIRQELREQAGDWAEFVSGSWTMWWQRLVAHNIAPNLTRAGGTILDSVPVHVAESVAAICTRHGVDTYCLSPQHRWANHPEAPLYKLLLIGRSYIIAREFSVCTLC